MKRLFLTTLIIGIGVFSSCDKEDFLAKKPRTSLLVPRTIEDFKKLLDNFKVINCTGSVLGEISADDYYLPDKQTWESIYVTEERNAYLWKEDLYEGNEKIADWEEPYEQILYANIVLEALGKLASGDPYEEGWIKGWAHFIRGHALYNLARQFALPYEEKTAKGALGIPIRLEPDVTVRSTRATLQQTYDQIIHDLEVAEALLPDKAPGTDRNRPYKTAAKALLARVYHGMGKYGEALVYAKSTLELYGRLMDFSKLDTLATSPIPELNEEVLFSSYPSSISPLTIGTYRNSPSTLVDSTLYRSYHKNDLRRSVFFTMSTKYGKPVYKGSYSGNIMAFTGLATDELYLIKAECEVREGHLEEGLRTLDKLLEKRWTGAYEPLTAPDRAAALEIVLAERRKELFFRGLRWQDLRRLNLEGRNIVLKRKLDGDEYELEPNSPLYVLPLPSNEIRMSGLEQNPR